MNKFPLLLSLLLSAPVFAHEGHGIEFGSHWHVSDALGFAIAIGVGLALWAMSGRK